ncbi:6-phospho-beta-glucosidase [Streptomyces sp. YGL11-2]|uniref:6-phospho-beta-glucosidase n=1 Tax=Streptomyces sp. YGL11-2 TaxID=3414028 RepID=UPI003CEF3761
MKLSILGGGGFRVPLVYRALLDDPARSVSGLTLYDTDPRRVAVISEVLARLAEGRRGAVPVRVADSLDAALTGADFVFSAIRVGGTAGRIRDERIPLSEGVLGQETVGAGGVLYGLRTIPVALHIAERVAALAPGAWVINFTNPAGMITEAMSQVLGDRVIGICDSPVGLVRRAARAAGADPAALSDPTRSGYDYVGLNHLGWLRSLTLDGTDLLPGLLADDTALGSFEEGRLFGADWLRTLGSLPNEYLHYYYFRRETLHSVRDTDQTRGEFLDRQQGSFFERAAAAGSPDAVYELWERTRLEREETYMAHSREASGGWQRDSHDLEGGGYDRVALALMHALVHDTGRRLILNVRNGTTVPQLAPDAIVETVCEVGAQGARPLACAPLREDQLGLMFQVKAVERATVEAAVFKDRSAALRALALHPLVDSPAVAARILERAAEGADTAGA